MARKLLLIFTCSALALLLEWHLFSGPKYWHSDDETTVINYDSLVMATINQFAAKTPADNFGDHWAYGTLYINVELPIAQNPDHRLSRHDSLLITTLITDVQKTTQCSSHWALQMSDNGEVQGIKLWKTIKVLAPPGHSID